MNGPSLEGSVILANICTMPIRVPIMHEGRRAIADGTIDFLAFVEMGQEIVAIALEIVADEIGVVAVGDKTHCFGEERVLDLDLLQADRAFFAGDFRIAGDLVDKITLASAPHREGEL